MSKCNISIELDSPSNRYASGETIRGVIKVSVDAKRKCKALTLELGWATHVLVWAAQGDTRRKERTVLKMDIFSGTWAAGEHACPFEITMPNGPHSFHGSYFNVDWYMRATANISWAGNSRAEQSFLLVSGPKTHAASYISGDSKTDGLASKRNNRDGSARDNLSPLTLLMIVVGAAMVFGTAYDVYGGIVKTVGAGVFGALIFLAGGMGVWDWIRGKIAFTKLKNLRVEWPRGIIQPGGKVPLEIYLDSDKRIVHASACLTCFEEFVYRDGRTNLQSLSTSSDATIPLQRVIGAEHAFKMKGELVLPEDAPPSFYAYRHQLSWKIVLKIKVKKWGECEREFYLDVRPRALGAELSATPARLAKSEIIEDDFEPEHQNTEAW